MKKSSFKHNTFSQASRNNFNIQGFKGVDYSTQRFLVANERAIDILNYIYKDGVVQKRNGFETIYHAQKTNYIAFGDESKELKINTSNFNGIWKFTAEDKKVHIIAHIGKLLYEIKNIDNQNIEIEPIVLESQGLVPVCYEFLDYKSSAFVGGNKLWFLGGNLYMCLRFFVDQDGINCFSFFPVEDSEMAPIPTTTIAITYEDSKAGGHRASIDRTNMLTMWRRNKLLSGTGKNDNELTSNHYEYVLDAPLLTKNGEEDMYGFSLVIETKGINYSYVLGDDMNEKKKAEFFNSTSKTTWRVVKYKDEAHSQYLNVEKQELVKDKYILIHSNPKIDKDINDNSNIAVSYSIYDLNGPAIRPPHPNVEGDNNLIPGLPNLFEVYIIGYLDDINDPTLNARIILFDDYKPVIEGVSNITVTFPCYNKDNVDKINHCKLGILFGTNNAQNRLFISGNDEYCNCDWHSGQISEDYSSCNFGYFEDTSFCFYGETDNAVVGYDIISNNRLLVLKTKSDKEKTIYFRTAELVEAIDASGNLVKDLNGNSLSQEGFSLIKGNGSVSCISSKAITNFNGDSVFLSDEKNLVGLDLVGIIGDTQRYANSRSYYIDNELKNCDLENAWLWTNNKYLLIILKDRIFMTHYQTKVDNQYEWWVANVENVQSILEFNGEFYFATSKGDLSHVTKEYEDISKIFIGKGGSLFMFSGNDKEILQVADEVINQLDKAKKYFLKIVPLDEDIESYLYQEIASVGNSLNNDKIDFTIDYTLNCLELTCNNDYDRINKLVKIIGDNEVFYLDSIDDYGNEFITDKKYLLKRFISNDTLLKNDCFKIYDSEKEEELNLSTLNYATLCCQLNKEYEIVEVNKDNATFKIKNNDEIVKVARFGSQNEYTQFKAQIICKSPVEAYFITKPFTFGSLNYFKTIWSWTLTNDTSIPSELEVAIASNKIPFENMRTLAKISKDKFGFDFNNLNYNKIDFDKNIVPRTYTNHRILSQLKFVCFGFRNLNNTNSVLSSMAIVYTTPFPSYGGD